jgi:hypothetical protein
MSSPLGYAAVPRYDGAVLERDERDQVVRCAVRPPDLAIVRDVWRYHFLTTDQLLELWWPGVSALAGRRRLVKLFRAGFLDGSGPSRAVARTRGRTTSAPMGTACSGNRARSRIRTASRPARSTTTATSSTTCSSTPGCSPGGGCSARPCSNVMARGRSTRRPGWVADPKDPFLPVDPNSSLYAEHLRDERPGLLRPDAILEIEDADS